MTTRPQRSDLDPTLPVELDPPTGGRPALAIARDEHTGAVDPEGVPAPVRERKPWMPPDFTGKTLGGRYEIERMLGFGGMATVYAARHISIQKPVAVKVLNPEYADDREIAGRFLQEARTASLLRHEHIIDITDFGHTDDGTVFFVMELLEGEDLSTTVMEDGPLPALRVIAIASQICEALEAAHARGIIHRDIKPANCFRIQRGANPDFIKVLDFGIAKVLGGLDREAARTTGTPLGTPGYMAIELLKGDTYDHRVDIYAVGVLMYKLLTNKMPFPAATAYGAAVRQLDGDPIPPSQAGPNLDVPGPLEALLLRAIARDPADRHQTVTELRLALADVEAILRRSDEPALAPPDLEPARVPEPAPALDLEPARAHEPEPTPPSPAATPVTATQSAATLSTAALSAAAVHERRWRATAIVGIVVVALLGLLASLFGPPWLHRATTAAASRAGSAAPTAIEATAPEPTPEPTPEASPEPHPTPSTPDEGAPEPEPADPTTPGPPPRGAPERALPRALTPAQISRRLDTMPALARCKEANANPFGVKSSLKVQLTIDPSGRVTEARAVSAGDLSSLGTCVLHAVRALRFSPAQTASSAVHTFNL